MTSPPSPVYRRRDFVSFISGRFLATAAMQVQSVAIGWQIYDIERTPLALGLVGACQFLPMFLLTLPAGEIADRLDQRRVFAAALAVQALCSALFLILSLTAPRDALPFYLILILFGAARGFSAPAGSSLLAFLVPPERLARSIALNSSVFTTAVIAGPSLGGFLYVFGPLAIYSVCMFFFFLSALLMMGLGGRQVDRTGQHEASRFARVVEGIRFVRERPVVLGAISLDLFAVLLGGAVALLPVYARDILHVGPAGLGVLRSAPAVGAGLTALALARWPIARRSGLSMFACVAIFGAATIVFGLSTSFAVSLVALAVTGASDMVSVYVRTSLINFATPDHMRGRVGAVNMLFIGASNELGEFESGITAALFGTVRAVVIGGLGTLAVVGAWMRLFPPLRDVDRLTDVSA
ncbi:MAG TPA: MFS transporter [Rhizomicrobium sp.]|jgi:MFS family permease|nr:MFS transporter [Rhizomicrobium sp.]